MSSVPSSSLRPSILCRRSATQTPPVWMPIMSGWVLSVGRNCSAMRPRAASTSIAAVTGISREFIEEGLEDGLGRHLIELGLVTPHGNAGLVQDVAAPRRVVTGSAWREWLLPTATPMYFSP